MTVQELINKSSQEVRRSPDLMAFYIDSFKAQFGKAPNCAGCTFINDFKKLKLSIEKGIKPTKTLTMENKEITFKLAKREGKIISFQKGGRTIRQYDNKMTEDFAVEYLTNGSKEEISDRRKKFKVLPAEIIEKDEKKASKSKAKQEDVPEETPEILLSENVSETTTEQPTEKPKSKRGRKPKNS